jgi:hypothetical protein
MLDILYCTECACVSHAQTNSRLSSSLGSSWYSTVKHSNVKNNFAIKGTVARDIFASVFFMDLLCMGARFRG